MALNVFVQMFHIWHRTERLQEAGAGAGDGLQRISRVPCRRREAAAEGTHSLRQVRLLFVPLENHLLWFVSTSPQLGSHISEMPTATSQGQSFDLYSECDFICFYFIFFPAQMIRSLKKTMSPVLSDISIEWLFPETKEVLLSPVGNTFLFPGDSLIGYCVVCDTTRYHTNPKSVSPRHLHKEDK